MPDKALSLDEPRGIILAPERAGNSRKAAAGMGKTMNDVARIAGVSQATVSRVINNRQDVSDELANQVHAAMRQLNYKPTGRQNKRALSSKKRVGGLVALLQFDEYHMAHIDVLMRAMHEIEAALADHGIGFATARATTLDRLPACFTNGQIMGILLDGVEPNREIMEAISTIPHIWLSSYRDDSGDHALVGNAQVSQMAARYLVERGHRRIAYMAACGRFPVMQARAEAFQFAVQRHKAEVSLFIDPQTPEEPKNSYLPLPKLELLLERLVDQMLAHKKPITGLFVPHDMMTASIYHILGRRGVRPGFDIEIISCGNQMSCLTGLYPRPATIDVGSELVGRHAVEQLLRSIEHPEESSRIRLIVEPVLIPGDAVQCERLG